MHMEQQQPPVPPPPPPLIFFVPAAATAATATGRNEPADAGGQPQHAPNNNIDDDNADQVHRGGGGGPDPRHPRGGNRNVRRGRARVRGGGGVDRGAGGDDGGVHVRPRGRGRGGHRGGPRVRGGRGRGHQRPREVDGVAEAETEEDPLLAQVRLMLAEAKKQITFCKEVQAKLESKEYCTRPSEGKNSPVWDVFQVVVHAVTGLPVGANQCTNCKNVVRAAEDGCTTTMSRHIRFRCKEGDNVRRIDPSPEAKKAAKEAITRACAEGMLSFDCLTSESMEDLFQAMIDIGSHYGPVSAKGLTPSPSTLSAHLREVADEMRRDIMPKIKEAIAAGACAATVDGWTEGKTQQHYLSFTVHIINKEWNLETEYLVTIAFDEEEETAENILKILLAALAALGITREELARITFVTDNGSNIVKALEEFRRHYCACHALNIALRSGMTLKYHELIERCLESCPRAKQIVETCDEAVRFIKDSRGKERNRRMAQVKRDLVRSKRHFQSFSQMLRRVVDSFDGVVEYLTSKGEGQRLDGITTDELLEVLTFLHPLDFDAGRESSSEVTLAQWRVLEAHAMASDADSEMVALLKATLSDELKIMQPLATIQQCKRLVKFLKTSDRLQRLGGKTVKQEFEVRWNSVVTMLESVDDAWDEIVMALGPGDASKLQGIDRAEVKRLVQFLKPFREETRKLEGESYPTLPLVHLAQCRLQAHCETPVLLLTAADDGEDDDMIYDLDESRAFALMRRNVLRHLSQTLVVTKTHLIATLLHPRYRKLVKLSREERDQVHAEVRAEIAKMAGPEPRQIRPPPAKKSKLDDAYGDFSCDGGGGGGELDLSDFVMLEDELDRYLREASSCSSEDLLHWWKTEGAVYPKLQALARRILCIPASSASSERHFSNAGFVINARRTQLSVPSVDAILFLHHHFKNLRLGV